MPDVPNATGSGAAALFIAVSGPGLFNGLIPGRIFEKGDREDIIAAEVIAGGVTIGVGIAAAHLTGSSLPFISAVVVVAVLVWGHERAMVDRFERKGTHGGQATGVLDIDDRFYPD